MEKLSIILLIIGLAVLVFALWSFLIIKKHITKYNRSSLSDEKYFELKARQEYIIATSAIIFGVLSFLGYASVNEIKADLSSQFSAERESLDSLYKSEKLKMDSLHNYADEANAAFTGLKIEGKDLKDSMRSSLALINTLKFRIAEISKKEVIRQNLFIVDNLHIKDFPVSKYKGEDFRYVSFKSLKTISGQDLPVFSEPPNIIVFTASGGQVAVTELSKNGFKIFPYMGILMSQDDIDKNIDDQNLSFSIWISQKEVFK